jgi:hypothetical protein
MRRFDPDRARLHEGAAVRGAIAYDTLPER